MKENPSRFGAIRAKRLSDASLEKLHKKGIIPGPVSFPLKSHEPFLQRLSEEKTETLAPGVHFHAYPHDLGDGNYVNVYSVSAEQTAGTALEVTSSLKPVYQRKRFKDPSVIAATSGGFFYLSDDDGYEPIDYTFNLCVRNGVLASLPTVTRNALITRTDGSYEVQELAARGICTIGGKEFAWVGGREPQAIQDTASHIMYGPACCSMMIQDDPITGQKRVVDREKNKTPLLADRADVVVIVKNGTHVVTRINEGGGTDFFSGTYILSLPRSEAQSVRVGDVVTHARIGSLDMHTVDSAINVGPSLTDASALDTDALSINHDASFGEKVFNLTSRVPRSVLFKDSTGEVHMRIYDGGKSEKGNGCTPREVLEEVTLSLAKMNRTLAWGVHLDGGKSSHLLHMTPSGELDGNGVLYYERWPSKNLALRTGEAERGNFFLVGPEGRRSASHVVLKRKTQYHNT